MLNIIIRSFLNYKNIILLLFILFLASCSNPLPTDKLHYVGDWQNKEMGLSISQDGNVSYKRVEGHTSTSVNGPITEFIGDDFVVGIWFITTNFKVTEPPVEIDGVWQMVVDGVRLKRVSE